MKYLKPYNSINESVNMHVSKIDFSKIESSFSIEDLLEVLESEDIHANYSEYQYFRRFIDIDGKDVEDFDKDNIGEKYFMIHQFNMWISVYEIDHGVTQVGSVFKQDISMENINSFYNLALETNNKFDKACKRVETLRNVSIKVKCNIKTSDSGNKRTVNLVFSLYVKENIPLDISKYYDTWSNNKVLKNILFVIDKLKIKYKNDGIENPDIDYNTFEFDDEESDIVNIGLFTEDEIVPIAIVYKKEGKYTIREEEYKRSLRYSNI